MWCYGCWWLTMSHGQYLGQSEGKRAGQNSSLWKSWKYFICVIYHSEVGLLQFPSPLFKPFSENSQLCVLSPQPPDLLLSLWGAALPLNTREINITIRWCPQQITPLTPTQQWQQESHKNSFSARCINGLKREFYIICLCYQWEVRRCTGKGQRTDKIIIYL